jgi:hypothetical protein
MELVNPTAYLFCIYELGAKQYIKLQEQTRILFKMIS